MSFLPTDLPSFTWGAALGAVAAFATGFLTKAGEHFFAVLLARIYPRPLEPVQVDGRFAPERYRPDHCAWVNEVNLYDYETKGYFYYPHPANGARCFRITSDGKFPLKEFLLVQPGSEALANG